MSATVIGMEIIINVIFFISFTVIQNLSQKSDCYIHYFKLTSHASAVVQRVIELESHVFSFNPFVSIGRTGTSNLKVKVMVICLNISFMI